MRLKLNTMQTAVGTVAMVAMALKVAMVGTVDTETEETQEGMGDVVDQDTTEAMEATGEVAIDHAHRGRVEKAVRATVEETGKEDKTDLKPKKRKYTYKTRKKKEVIHHRTKRLPDFAETGEPPIQKVDIPPPPGPRPVGSPPKYREEFCEMVIEHMAKGFSVESFGGVAGVTDNTIHTWMRTHKNFYASVKIGSSRSRRFWEQLGIDGASGKIPNFNAATWIFNLKNRFGWTDKQEHLIAAVVQHDLKKIETLPIDEVIKIGKNAIEYLESKEEEEPLANKGDDIGIE